MENSTVTLEINSESIYMHSISVLSFFSMDKFKVRLSYEKSRIHRGIRDGECWIKSVKNDNHIYCVEISVIGLFNEQLVNDCISEDVLGNHYGMRFYPFLSSYIKGEIECNRRILNVSLKLPDTYRLLFFKSSIKQNGTPSTLRHSYGKEMSSYLFTWDHFDNSNQDIDANSVSIPVGTFKLHPEVFVRLGGRSLFRLVKFPVYYWIIAFFSIFLLAFTENKYVVFGAFATTWLFMLERWDKSSLPQQNTLLTLQYLIYGFLIGIWGIAWALFCNNVKNLCDRLSDFLLFAFNNNKLSYQGVIDAMDIGIVIIFFLLTLIIVTIILSFRAINYFEINGKLPKYISYVFARSIIKGDIKRKKMQAT